MSYISILAKCQENNNDMVNKALLWDYIKCEIRGATISYASFKAKQRRQQETFLINQLGFLEQNIDEGKNVPRGI